MFPKAKQWQTWQKQQRPEGALLFAYFGVPGHQDILPPWFTPE
jgi:hypothetical protein